MSLHHRAHFRRPRTRATPWLVPVTLLEASYQWRQALSDPIIHAEKVRKYMRYRAKMHDKVREEGMKGGKI